MSHYKAVHLKLYIIKKKSTPPSRALQPSLQGTLWGLVDARKGGAGLQPCTASQLVTVDQRVATSLVRSPSQGRCLFIIFLCSPVLVRQHILPRQSSTVMTQMFDFRLRRLECTWQEFCSTLPALDSCWGRACRDDLGSGERLCCSPRKESVPGRPYVFSRQRCWQPAL